MYNDDENDEWDYNGKSYNKCRCGKAKESKYPLCFVCSMKKKGWLICPNCEENYYDPDKYKQCYLCHQEDG